MSCEKFQREMWTRCYIEIYIVHDQVAQNLIPGLFPLQEYSCAKSTECFQKQGNHGLFALLLFSLQNRKKYLPCTLILRVNLALYLKFHLKQECIPVGCVPAARWPYAGVCCRGGLLRGVCSGGCPLWGGCLLQGGVYSGGCLLPGVSALGGVCSGGCLLRGVVSAPGGCVCSWGVLPQTCPPPVNRMTDRCNKNAFQ